MKRFEKRVIFINIFGAAGYLVLLLTWTLFASVVLMGLMDASVLHMPVVESTQSEGSRPEPSGVLTVSAYVITGLAVLVSAAVVILLPYLVGRWGSKFVRICARLAKTPLGHRSMLSIKLLLLLAASMGMFIAGFFLPPENTEVFAVQLFGSVCAVVTVAFFSIQHLIAKRMKLKIEKVW